jgi:ATP synthase delta (OSCP) subunit
MAAFVSRYAGAVQDAVISAKLDAFAIDEQFNDHLGTWSGSAELREFFVNPAIPGGTVVRVGSAAHDGSASGRLERLKESPMAE